MLSRWVLLSSIVPILYAQNTGAPSESKHILGIIPNYRSSPDPNNYQPLSPKEKFKIAARDSFDQGTVALGAIFAAQSQLQNSNRSFGQGVKGYATYWGASYGDFLAGNMMTEGIFPSLLHQDPRYFRRGEGSFGSRLLYSMRQIVWTRTDAGGHQFNYSEILGNAAAVGISDSYYTDNRTASSNASRLGIQVGLDMGSNLLREFWPDMTRRLEHKKPEP